MLRFAGQSVSRKMDGEACPAGRSQTVLAMFDPSNQWNWHFSGMVLPTFLRVVHRSSIVFGNSVSANRAVLAACGCVRNTMVFCSWILYIVFLCNLVEMLAVRQTSSNEPSLCKSFSALCKSLLCVKPFLCKGFCACTNFSVQGLLCVTFIWYVKKLVL